MKLVFPNGECKQTELNSGLTIVGAAPNCDVVINSPGVAARHAQLEQGPKGTTIKVFDVTNITRINGELVVATRFLKNGDALLFGDVQSVVVGEPDTPAPVAEPQSEVTDPGSTRLRHVIPGFVLRGVSGSSFGKTFPIAGKTLIGRSAEADILLKTEEVSRNHAEIRVASDGLHIEDLGSSNGTFVNGKQVKRSKLEPGDEIKFDTERFLVQAPGADFAAPEPVTTSDPEPAAAQVGTSKWLLVLVAMAAAVALWRLFGGGLT